MVALEQGHTPSWYRLQIAWMCMDGCAFMIDFVCNIWTPMSYMNNCNRMYHSKICGHGSLSWVPPMVWVPLHGVWFS